MERLENIALEIHLEKPVCKFARKLFGAVICDRKILSH
jgi:hypothetical protein